MSRKVPARIPDSGDSRGDGLKGPAPSERYRCPCCFYMTLDEEAGYDICDVCGWEDDGQDDDDADEVRGGPNGDLSLTQGRYNFARIGASGWPDLRHREPVQPPGRAPGSPFAHIARLEELPPFQEWPAPWVLSFHPIERRLEERWRHTVGLLLKHGFRFQGTYEVTERGHADRGHPRLTRAIEFDPQMRIESMDLAGDTVIVACWFHGPSGGGARLKLEEVWAPREDGWESAVSVEAYLPKTDVLSLFSGILKKWPLLMGLCSPYPWGLPTLAGMSVRDGLANVGQFVIGRTFLASDLATPDFLDAVRERFGPQAITGIGSGYLIWRGENP